MSVDETSHYGTVGVLQAVYLTADPSFLPVLANLFGIYEAGSAQVRRLAWSFFRHWTPLPLQPFRTWRNRYPLIEFDTWKVRSDGLVQNR